MLSFRLFLCCRVIFLLIGCYEAVSVAQNLLIDGATCCKQVIKAFGQLRQFYFVSMQLELELNLIHFWFIVLDDIQREYSNQSGTDFLKVRYSTKLILSPFNSYPAHVFNLEIIQVRKVEMGRPPSIEFANTVCCLVHSLE